MAQICTQPSGREYRDTGPGRRDEAVAFSLPPLSQEDGSHGSAETAAVMARLAALEAENRALKDESAHIHRILRSARDYAIITTDDAGQIKGWNAGAEALIGYTNAEAVGRSAGMIFTTEDRDAGQFALELARALENGRAVNERWHVRRDGTRFWASGLMMPLLDADGRPDGFLNILRDRSDVRAQAERRELMVAEMNHRVKNTFAMVQAIAMQTARHSTSVADFQAVFGKRLAALARSHDALVAGKWTEAPLQNLIEGALGVYCEQAGRVTIEGPAVLLAANLVVTLTLAFHELATNATKYGALSVPEGSVSVTWNMTPASRCGQTVELLWQERGGPAVSQPSRRGFGSQLLESGLKQFGGSFQQDYQPGGLECRICLPIGTRVSQKVSSAS